MTEYLDYLTSCSFPQFYGSSLLPEESRLYQEAKILEKLEGKLSSSKHRSKAWYTPKYAEFIGAVNRRDNCCCTRCGAADKLQVHHKDAYNWCESRRFDISNGITLCERCHKRFHKRYGEFTSFQRQFDEWSISHIILTNKFSIYDMDIQGLNGVKSQLKRSKRELVAMLESDPDDTRLLTIREIININFDEVVYLKDQLKKRMAADALRDTAPVG